MIYCPRISPRSLCRLRRIAWAVNRPMTRTLDRLIDAVCRRIDAQKVCTACRDQSTCDLCALKAPVDAEASKPKAPDIRLTELS